jgi:hypothetical protein
MKLFRDVLGGGGGGCEIPVRPSAYKHGIKLEDMYYVIEHYVDKLYLEEDPDKILYVGYDIANRELEVVVTEFSNGQMYITHAMKIRKSTLDEIKREKYGR